MKYPLMAWLLCVASCASPRSLEAPVAGGEDRCPTVVVVNDGYYDARVYVDEVRVGFITGNTTAVFENMCRIQDRDMHRIVVKEMAGRQYRVEYSGPSKLYVGQGLYVQIGVAPQFSWARFTER